MVDMKLRECKFNDLYLCDWTPWQKETNIKCPSCGCPHMDNIGLTRDGFPKYKCGYCKVSTDESPRNIEARRKIDNAIKSNLIHKI